MSEGIKELVYLEDGLIDGDIAPPFDPVFHYLLKQVILGRLPVFSGIAYAFFSPPPFFLGLPLGRARKGRPALFSNSAMKGALPKGCPVWVGFLMAAKISGASVSERMWKWRNEDRHYLIFSLI